MKNNSWKMVGLVLLVGLMLCAVTLAGKHEKCKGKADLPDEVTAKIKADYPQAQIEEIKVEKEAIKVYKVELEQNDKEIELALSADGSILETESEIDIASLPKKIADAIKAQAKGGEIDEVTKETEYMEIRIVKLKKPKITYEAEVKAGGKKIEIEVAADGTVLKSDDADNDADEEKECDDDSK